MSSALVRQASSPGAWAIRNQFRARFDGMRVRAFIHVRQDDEAGIDRDAYYTVESISQHAGMREQVVGDLTRRMKSTARELKMWGLSEEERAVLFRDLALAMDS